MIRKPRAPRPVRRTGTEVHADSRTARQRTRADAERAALREELELEAEREQQTQAESEARYFLLANGFLTEEEYEDQLLEDASLWRDLELLRELQDEDPP